MDDYKNFLEIIKSNLSKKGILAKRQKQILSIIAAKYKNSVIFCPLERLEEEEDDDWELTTFTHVDIQEESVPVADGPFKEEHIKKLQEEYGWHRLFTAEQEEDLLNGQDQWGRSPLHLAVLEGDRRKIKELIILGADDRIKDNNGHTPYLLAVFEGKDEIIRFLKENNVQDSCGRASPGNTLTEG